MFVFIKFPYCFPKLTLVSDTNPRSMIFKESFIVNIVY